MNHTTPKKTGQLRVGWKQEPLPGQQELPFDYAPVEIPTLDPHRRYRHRIMVRNIDPRIQKAE